MTDAPATTPHSTAWRIAGAAAAVVAVHGGLLLGTWRPHGQGGPDDDDATVTVATLVSAPDASDAKTPPTVAVTSRRPTAAARRPAAPTPDTVAAAEPSPTPAETSTVDPLPTQSATPGDGASAADLPPGSPQAPSASTVPEPQPPTTMAPQERPPTVTAATSASDSTLNSKATPPESARWNYDASIKVGILSLSGNAWLNWQQDGQHYQAELQYQVLGRTMQQTSTGTLSERGLQPDAFVEKGRRTVFDHAAQQVRRDGSETGVPLPAGTHDKLSVIIQLGSLLAALPDGPHPGDRWVMPVAGNSAIAPWTFRYIEEPAHGTPGAGNTWQVAYEPPNPEDDQIHIWYARHPSGLPLRLLIRQSSGNAVDLRYRGP